MKLPVSTAARRAVLETSIPIARMPVSSAVQGAGRVQVRVMGAPKPRASRPIARAERADSRRSTESNPSDLAKATGVAPHGPPTPRARPPARSRRSRRLRRGDEGRRATTAPDTKTRRKPAGPVRGRRRAALHGSREQGGSRRDADASTQHSVAETSSIEPSLDAPRENSTYILPRRAGREHDRDAVKWGGR